ncbi:hypothetical protein AN218_17060 [Streptomyces nanshensis]|uniref:Uncharacterized protein n=2 Tax=Streptomyces nanshensis TaxID=518642 RepID=A0A1E7L3F4_9ACTN|nr:hypothetical protein AN218_17060 [Streptomyces nanshensis]
MLQYMSEVTEADVEALRDFMTARLRGIQQRHPEGSDECRAAAAIFEFFRLDCPELLQKIDRKVDLDGSEPFSTRIEAEQDVRDIIEMWSTLVHLAQPWEGSPGFNSNRWKITGYGTREAEAWMAEHPPSSWL